MINIIERNSSTQRREHYRQRNITTPLREGHLHIISMSFMLVTPYYNVLFYQTTGWLSGHSGQKKQKHRKSTENLNIQIHD